MRLPRLPSARLSAWRSLEYAGSSELTLANGNALLARMKPQATDVCNSVHKRHELARRGLIIPTAVEPGIRSINVSSLAVEQGQAGIHVTS